MFSQPITKIEEINDPKASTQYLKSEKIAKKKGTTTNQGDKDKKFKTLAVLDQI